MGEEATYSQREPTGMSYQSSYIILVSTYVDMCNQGGFSTTLPILLQTS